MSELKGSQRKHLRGLAHDLKPVVLIGKNGVAEMVLKSIDQALNDHELIKVKFIDFKDEKKTLAAKIAENCGSELAGLIGNVAIFYRQQKDPKKRKIQLPG